MIAKISSYIYHYFFFLIMNLMKIRSNESICKFIEKWKKLGMLQGPTFFQQHSIPLCSRETCVFALCRWTMHIVWAGFWAPFHIQFSRPTLPSFSYHFRNRQFVNTLAWCLIQIISSSQLSAGNSVLKFPSTYIAPK